MNVLRPLEGIVVVETDAIVSLAFCGKYLAALGARVYIRHDGTRFAGAPLSLRSYLDDGKTLVGDNPSIGTDYADIVLSSAARADAPADHDPGQIRVAFSDFGAVGPRSDWTGSELVAQAAGGLLDLIGDPGRSPVRLGGHQLDYAVGLSAFTGVMLALHARSRTRIGQRVDVSRLETTTYIEWKGGTYAQAGRALERGESSGPLVVDCADGAFGLFYRPSDWPSIVDVLDSPALEDARFATQPDRIRHLAELREMIGAVTSSMSRQELYEQLQARGVPAGPVFDARDLLRSPQYATRKYFVPLPGAGPDVLQPAVPFVFNRQRPVPSHESDVQEPVRHLSGVPVRS